MNKCKKINVKCFRTGQFKGYAKQIEVTLSPPKEQRRVYSSFPIFTVYETALDVRIPNCIGIKKVTIDFDYHHYLIKGAFINKRLGGVR